MKNLTFKELKFIEEYLTNGFNGSGAYQVAYETDNRDVAKAEAWALLRKPKIQFAIEDSEQSYRALAREMKIGRKNILKEVIVVVKSDNHKEKLAGINLICKLTGGFSPERKDVSIEYESNFNVDISKLSKEELLALRTEILASL